MSCWTGTRRTASVVAITASELFRLERVSLLAIAAHWPDIINELNFKTPGPVPGEKEHRAPLTLRLCLGSCAALSGQHMCAVCDTVMVQHCNPCRGYPRHLGVAGHPFMRVSRVCAVCPAEAPLERLSSLFGVM